RPRWNYARLLNYCRQGVGDLEVLERQVPVRILLETPVPAVAELMFNRSEVEDSVDAEGAVVPKQRAGFQGSVYPLHTGRPFSSLLHPDGKQFNRITKAWPRIPFLESTTVSFPAEFKKWHFPMTILDILPDCPSDRYPCGNKAYYLIEEIP